MPGVWDAADDGAEHEGCDKREQGQVDEALHTIVAEARQRLHVVLSRKDTKPGTELRTGGGVCFLGHTGCPMRQGRRPRDPRTTHLFLVALPGASCGSPPGR